MLKESILELGQTCPTLFFAHFQFITHISVYADKNLQFLLRDSVVPVRINSPRIKLRFPFQHGESEFNVTGRIGGDAPLSPRGRLYAQALAKHVQSLNIPSLQVWTSTLKRTKATAAGIQAPQQHLPELDEIYSVSHLN